MPNTGRPSRGCQECKDRKVKCDQNPTACNRCTRNGRQCSSYPSETDVQFRNNFTQVARKTRERRRNIALDLESTPQSLTIAPPMATNWHQQAIGMFLNDYVIDPQDSGIHFGYLQTLPDLMKSTGDSSALSEAVSAVALTSLSHRSSLSYVEPAGSQAYGRALRLFNGQLRTQADLSDDRTLATILCLDLYEMIKGDRPPGMIWSHHIDILEAILEARKARSDLSPDSRDLSYTAHSYLLTRNLATGRHLKAEARFPDDTEQEPLVIQMRKLIYATCQFSTELKQLLQDQSSNDEFVEALSNLAQSGNAVNDRLKAWEIQASELHKYQVLDVAEFWPKETFLATKGVNLIHIYDTLTLASLWNGYRTTRLFLIRDLLKLLSQLPSKDLGTDFIDPVTQLQDQSRTLANAICASVPYMLGEVDQEASLQAPRHSKAVGGLWLLWPLGAVLALKILPEERNAWIRKRVTYIRDALGIQQADVVLGLAGP